MYRTTRCDSWLAQTRYSCLGRVRNSVNIGGISDFLSSLDFWGGALSIPPRSRGSTCYIEQVEMAPSIPDIPVIYNLAVDAPMYSGGINFLQSARFISRLDFTCNTLGGNGEP